MFQNLAKIMYFLLQSFTYKCVDSTDYNSVPVLTLSAAFLANASFICAVCSFNAYTLMLWLNIDTVVDDYGRSK